MRIGTIIISLFLLFTSCEIADKKPENIFSQEKMTEVIMDMQLLEATFNSRLLHVKDKDTKMRIYYDEIFSHHEISEISFNESYSYYQDYPKQLEQIYEKVFEELERMQTEQETRKGKN